jgi:hypothetical protein
MVPSGQCPRSNKSNKSRLAPYRHVTPSPAQHLPERQRCPAINRTWPLIALTIPYYHRYYHRPIDDLLRVPRVVIGNRRLVPEQVADRVR